MSDHVSVTVIPNGPYKVSNASTVRFCGEPLPIEGDVYLCRCGQSANAPFCDGSHKRVGFNGEREARADKPVNVWEGTTIRTYFNPNTCMHAGYCKPLKELRERELAGDAAAATEIIAVISSCPSGALTYEARAAVTVPVEGVASADIEIMEGGEIRLQCDFDIDADRPARQREARGTLCRCGLSKSKPWCDGRHKSRNDFR